MSEPRKKTIVRRILSHREAIKTHDEAMVGLLDGLAASLQPGEKVVVDGNAYAVQDIFAEGSATWRPARVHRWHLVQSKA